MIVGFSRKFSSSPTPPGSPVIWARSSSITGLSNGGAIGGSSTNFPNEGSLGGYLRGTGNNPTYNTTVTLNGKPCVEFVAASSQTLHASANGYFSFLWTEATIYFVGQLKNDPPAVNSKCGIWQCGDRATGATTHYDHGNAFPFTDGIIYDSTFTTVRKTVGNPTPSLASPFYYGVRSKANQWDCHLNGTQLFTTGTNTFNDNQNVGDVDWNFGGDTVPLADGGTTVYYDGYLWEIVCYGSYLNSTDLASLETYFHNVYGI